MSGGPVLAGDETQMAALALVSSDWDHQNSDGGLAALFTPSVAIKAEHLTIQTESGTMKDPTIWEMIQGGVILAVGSQR